VTTLTAEQMRAFQHDYTSALTDLLRTDNDPILNPEVIYAFGRKPSPPTATDPAAASPIDRHTSAVKTHQHSRPD
jgi:hypothetical protein